MWSEMKYFELKLLAFKILAIFASTQTCEAAFSALSNIKSKLRNSLTDANVKNALICAVSTRDPDLLSIVKDKDCQISH